MHLSNVTVVILVATFLSLVGTIQSAPKGAAEPAKLGNRDQNETISEVWIQTSICDNCGMTSLGSLSIKVSTILQDLKERERLLTSDFLRFRFADEVIVVSRRTWTVRSTRETWINSPRKETSNNAKISTSGHLAITEST